MSLAVRILKTLTLLACLVAHARSASGSTVLFRSDAQLIAVSERVVHGRVVRQRFVADAPPGQRIYTVTTLAVIEDLTAVEGDTLEVWELGGIAEGRIFFVGGMVEYRPGAEVLVCLDRGPRGLRSLGMGFSKFDVQRTAAGDATLIRDMRDTMVVGGALAPRERSLAEFRQLAAQVLGRSSRVVENARQPTITATESWTKLVGEPGWRWREADFGTPLRVFKNTSAPPPLVSGDAVPEFQTALSAWTNPSSASVILNYAGTAFESFYDGGWTTIPARSTLVTFEDPNEDLGGTVLAIGGGSATPNTGGTVGGTTYHGFTSGFVVFQNAAELDVLDPSFRQSLNFTRVLTHEIGHTIGFGHTETDGSVTNPTRNIMYQSCCFANTPTPPALGPDDLIGLNVVYPAGPSSGPAMALDKTSLRFGATTSAGAFTARTSAQVVRLTKSGTGTVSWTATPTRPWLQVSPTSGTGPVDLLINVVANPNLPASGVEDGAIVFTYSGASNAPGPIAVRLTLTVNGQSTSPFGFVDTPFNNTTGVTGAIPFTGWALDDIEVADVTLCRAAVAGESPPLDARCAGTAQFFVGSSVFIDGARPDVHAAFPGHPLSTRGGWGLMVLTNMLPAQGNGTYQFSIYAQDREGRSALLGTRTLTCDNAHATKPFGTIDTPAQGGIASGASYVNFGWVLTPQPKTIPLDGSTMTVLVDGVARGTVNYNHERADIEALFPGFRNTDGTNGGIGFRVIDTRTLANGLHTISWVVSDDQGVSEGIGSRFFMVSNNASALTTAATAAASGSESAETAVAIAPVAETPILGRRGWNPAAAWRSYGVNTAGRTIVRGEEVDRIELQLPTDEGTRYTGSLRTNEGLAPLPAGSTLRGAVFTWAPGPGFVGTYDLVFVRWLGTSAVSRQEVRVVLQPKTTGLVGPQVVIDLPRMQQDVGQPFVLAGWAADPSSPAGTGIATLHAWAYPLAGGPPVFLGATAYGGARPDVAAVHGDQFRDSGFGLLVQGLTHGHYDLAVFAWSTEAGDFVPAKVVRVTVR
jgi:hypothetical protein